MSQDLSRELEAATVAPRSATCALHVADTESTAAGRECTHPSCPVCIGLPASDRPGREVRTGQVWVGDDGVRVEVESADKHVAYARVEGRAVVMDRSAVVAGRRHVDCIQHVVCCRLHSFHTSPHSLCILR